MDSFWQLSVRSKQNIRATVLTSGLDTAKVNAADADAASFAVLLSTPVEEARLRIKIRTFRSAKLSYSRTRDSRRVNSDDSKVYTYLSRADLTAFFSIVGGSSAYDFGFSVSVPLTDPSHRSLSQADALYLPTESSRSDLS